MDFDARKSENISAFISEPRRGKKGEKTNFSNHFPKPLMISPTLKSSRRNYSMLQSSHKYNNDDIASTIKGFDFDY